ncbi:transporter substrate-binding domain-containing protein [Siminovitchia fortis]|uniref:histidine kinase n=1 Tax=Siminovitchia fortis TaxID=254758 RepID=A0A443IT06_9BACI|nr:transporter substrate-binding domain-containing protein [Siminovitchia fortis]RWR10046.1 transporter substrate-binding domain-containing protein [Siminovitchia fortis]WHY80740.1 transporter substrate-binding domain-containing protein [Siminovitchia fortis]
MGKIGKRYFKISFLFILFLLIQGTSVYSPAAFADKKTYKIAGEWALPPFSYMKEDRALAGMSIDIMEKISEENGLEFEYIPMSIEDAKKALKDGKIDAIAGISYNAENESWFDFSDPYFMMSYSLIIPKEKKESIKKISDIRDSHIVIENNSPVLATLQNMRNTDLTIVTNQYAGLLTLVNEKADVFIGNKWTASFYLKHIEQEDGFVILDEVIEPADYSIAVKKGNEDLLRQINQTLTTLKARDELNPLVDGWLRPKSEAEIIRLKQFVFFLSIVLSVVALVLLIIYIWNQRLKKAVSKQTHALRLLNENLKKQRQEIADSNVFKDQILNNIDTGIVTFGLDFTIKSWNSRALDILSQADGELNDIQHSSSLLNKLLRVYDVKDTLQEETAETIEVETGRNGQKKVIYYRILRMYDSQMKLTGYILAMNDETEKMKLQQKLITQEKLHALGQLVAGVAHEIRNPLTSIKTFIDMLPKKYDRPEFRDLIVEHLPAEVNRLNTIVTDLVEYARPRPSNKQRYTAPELASLIKFLQVTVDKKGIILEKSIDEKLVFYIDPQQIRQVILNLILNAIDAVEESTEKRIVIGMEMEDANYGKITISDTGKGINEEDLTRIFEPFYTSKEKGVGLGLTLSYNLIKENNGDIHVESQPSQGTVFTILLPLYETGGDKS